MPAWPGAGTVFRQLHPEAAKAVLMTTKWWWAYAAWLPEEALAQPWMAVGRRWCRDLLVRTPKRERAAW